MSVEIEGNNVLFEKGEGIVIPPGRYHAPITNQSEIEHFSVSFSVTGGKLALELSEKIHLFLSLPL